ncbi:hypothetical protein CR513_28776, partial [Mucuna pruriens]
MLSQHSHLGHPTPNQYVGARGNSCQVEVQPGTLLALAQFYDPSIRSITFKDFQLAPTLEEYERILGQSLTERRAYLYQGNFPSWVKVAKIDKKKVEKKWGGRNPLSLSRGKIGASGKARRI